MRAWLEGQLTVPVTLLSYAHSGAVISAQALDGSACFTGEVPDDAPSITAQAWWAAGAAPLSWPDASGPPSVPARDIDLVLVDGGINDVGVSNILFPPPIGPDPAALSSETARCCGDRMRGLLMDVARLFPNARVVVGGYYPIVTAESDPHQIPELITVLGLATAGLGAGALLLGFGGEAVLHPKMIARSKQFYDQSTAAIRGAIAQVNQGFRKDFRFADPMFGPRNAFAAPDSWLWPAFAPDPPRDGRVQACRARYGSSPAVKWRTPPPATRMTMVPRPTPTPSSASSIPSCRRADILVRPARRARRDRHAIGVGARACKARLEARSAGTLGAPPPN